MTGISDPCGPLDPGDQIAAEMAAVDLTGLLTATAAVMRYQQAGDGLGGRTEAWVADAETMPCYVTQIRPNQPVRQGERKENSTDPYSVKYPLNWVLRIRDRLVIGTDTFEVQAVIDKGTLSFLNTAWCVMVVPA